MAKMIRKAAKFFVNCSYEVYFEVPEDATEEEMERAAYAAIPEYMDYGALDEPDWALLDIWDDYDF